MGFSVDGFDPTTSPSLSEDHKLATSGCCSDGGRSISFRRYADEVPEHMFRNNEKAMKPEKCPILVRVFVKANAHNGVALYSSGSTPPDEVRLYLGPSSTLRDVADLIAEAKPELRRPRVQLSMAVVYPDKLGRQTMKVVGKLHISRPTTGDGRTLASLRFEAGDFIDIAVLE